MKKFTLFLSAMLFSVMSFAGVVTFTPADFEGQGKSGTGSPVTVTKDGVTVSCDKGYGNSYALRCYKDGVVTISATENIASLEFAFDTYDGRYYNGNLEESYTVGANTWNVTLSSQARFTSIKVTLGDGNDNPGENPGETTEVVLSDLAYAMAFYIEEEGAAYWEIELFNLDATGENLEFPLAALGVEAKSKTALNGTYDMLMAVYGTGEDAEGYIEGVYMSEDAAGTLTIKNVDNEGTYSFVGSFVGEDGKTYKINTESFMIWVEDGATGEEIVLNENAGDTPNPSGMITCAEAAQIAAAENYKGTDNVTVYGYVVELIKEKVDDKTGRNKQSFWMSDTKGGEKQFQAFYAFVPENFFKVGDQVAVTGILQNYKGTIEIADGEAVLLEVTTGVEDVVLNENLMKVIKNGQMYIIRDGKAYNVLGAQVK
jgi:hypothetical protein